MFGKVFEYITDADELTPPQASNLHFKTDYLQKTFIGGLISMGVSLYVVYVAITKGIQMFSFDGPTITSIAEKMNYDDVG